MKPIAMISSNNNKIVVGLSLGLQGWHLITYIIILSTFAKCLIPARRSRGGQWAFPSDKIRCPPKVQLRICPNFRKLQTKGHEMEEEKENQFEKSSCSRSLRLVAHHHGEL